MNDQIGDAADPAGNDRLGQGHGLDQHPAHPFIQRGKRKYIKNGHDRCRVGTPSGEADPVSHTHFCSPFSQFRLKLPVAKKYKGGIRTDRKNFRSRLKKMDLTFYGSQSADGPHYKIARRDMQRCLHL